MLGVWDTGGRRFRDSHQEVLHPRREGIRVHLSQGQWGAEATETVLAAERKFICSAPGPAVTQARTVPSRHSAKLPV